MSDNNEPHPSNSSENDNANLSDLFDQLNDEAWVIEHWEELGASGQMLAFQIYGFQCLWDKILD